jgi:uncharacterized protein DUF3309
MNPRRRTINRLDWNVNPGRLLSPKGVEDLGGTRVLGTILLIVLVLLLLGALPTWPHSANWGYYPSGGVGLLLVILIVLLVAGRI